jgi:prepilin-type N-terminal cleavage/methylation domain-containing protein
VLRTLFFVVGRLQCRTLTHGRPRRTDSPRAGFTLIELLVVLALVGILAGILLRVYRGVKDRAREKTCANNLRQLYTAFALYAADYGGHLLPPELGDPPWCSREKDDIRLLGAYDPYGCNRDIWHCPAQARARTPEEGEALRSHHIANLNLYHRSYVYNWLAELRPSKLLTVPWNRVTDEIVRDAAFQDSSDPVDPFAFAPHGPRRQSRMNIMHTDGHVESMALEAAIARWDEWPRSERP